MVHVSVAWVLLELATTVASRECDERHIAVRGYTMVQADGPRIVRHTDRPGVSQAVNEHKHSLERA